MNLRLALMLILGSMAVIFIAQNAAVVEIDFLGVSGILCKRGFD
jgi:hypothetical protein